MTILTTAAVAALLDCTEETVQIRATAGDLPGIKIGRSWVFPEAALLARLNDMALEGAVARRSGGTPTAVQFKAPTPARGRRTVMPASLARAMAAGGAA